MYKWLLIIHFVFQAIITINLKWTLLDDYNLFSRAREAMCNYNTVIGTNYSQAA